MAKQITHQGHSTSNEMMAHALRPRILFNFFSVLPNYPNVHENDEINILNLRHTMFNVHKVTFTYIRILPNLTIQQYIYLST